MCNESSVMSIVFIDANNFTNSGLQNLALNVLKTDVLKTTQLCNFSHLRKLTRTFALRTKPRQTARSTKKKKTIQSSLKWKLRTKDDHSVIKKNLSIE